VNPTPNYAANCLWSSPDFTAALPKLTIFAASSQVTNFFFSFSISIYWYMKHLAEKTCEEKKKKKAKKKKKRKYPLLNFHSPPVP
jgi:hypothetical protein